MTAPDVARIRWLRLARRARAVLAMRGLTPRQACKKLALPHDCRHALVDGRRVPARTFLELCAFIGIDPVTQEIAAPGAPAFRGEIPWHLVSLLAEARRHREGLTLDGAAEACGVTLATYSRFIAGAHVDALSFLRICAFIGSHPNDLTVEAGSPVPVAPEALLAGSGHVPVARNSSLPASCDDGIEPDYDGRDDGARSYDFGRRCQREIAIRDGLVAPMPDRDHELRWAAEGPRPMRELDLVTGGVQ